MARLTRRAFRRRTSLSKYESALEAALKEVDLVKVTDDVTLDRVPDVILVEAGALSAPATVTISIDSSAPQAANRIVRVVNDEAEDAVTVKVISGAGVSVAAGDRSTLLIEDASVADSQIEIS